MAVAVRVIPCLDVSAGRVVKGVNFRNLRDAGDPVELARVYDRDRADELTFLDVSAGPDCWWASMRVSIACVLRSPIYAANAE